MNFLKEVIIVGKKKKRSNCRFILKKKKKSGKKIQVSVHLTQEQIDKVSKLSEISGQNKSYIHGEALDYYFDNVEVVD
ncbi:MAG: hypothetical protein CI947_1795 [Halanaerobium sp.]|nr:MAG: hypothetical protein CI947_1795 [Halanaerobium sp.]